MLISKHFQGQRGILRKRFLSMTDFDRLRSKRWTEITVWVSQSNPEEIIEHDDAF